jgi:hypothetical protein
MKIIRIIKIIANHEIIENPSEIYEHQLKVHENHRRSFVEYHRKSVKFIEHLFNAIEKL